MSAPVAPVFPAPSALACTLASLPADSNLLAGRSSVAWDDTTTKYEDYDLTGTIKTGTSPTGGSIYLYALAMLDDTTWPDVFDGTDKAVTVTSTNVANSLLFLVKTIVPTTTSNVVYPFGPISLMNVFGGLYIPPKGQIFVVHNTGVNLNASGHVLNLRGKNRTVG